MLCPKVNLNNVNLISAEDRIKFRKLFPEAYSFLKTAELKGELLWLRADAEENRLNDWQIKRLQELEESNKFLHLI